MATFFYRETQEDGTVVVIPIKVEIHGTGIVTNPEEGGPDG